MRKLILSRFQGSLVLAWFVCSLAALFYTYEYMLRIEPGIMVHDLERHFAITAGGLGLLASMYYWAYTPLQLVVGIITDHFGARRVLISAIVACTVGVLIFGYTSNYAIASGGRFLVGAGSAFAFVGALKLGADWLPRRYFSLFVGLCTSLGMLGAMFGETAMSWIVVHWSWHPVIVYSAWLGLILIVVFSLFVYEKYELLGKMHQTKPVNFKALGGALLKLITNKTMMKAGLIGCSLFLSLSLLAEQWGNSYIQKVLHVNAEAASYYVDMIFFGWFVGSPVSGYLSERLRSRKRPVFWGSILAICAFMPIILIPRHLPHFILGFLLFLFGFFCSSEINCFAIARDLVRARLAATAVGLMNAMVMISGMIIQPMFAYTLTWMSQERQGPGAAHKLILVDYQRALMIIPFFLLLSVIAAWRMKGSYEIGTRGHRRHRIDV